MLFLRGRVVNEDGSPPGQPVTIEKVCVDKIAPQRVATTDGKGEFNIHIEVADVEVFSGSSCVLRASLKGYQSTTIEFADWRLFQDPNLAPMTLTRQTSDRTSDVFDQEHVPQRAARAWMRAARSAGADHWPEAEHELRAVVEIAPRFAQGWQALALVLSNQHKIEEARQAAARVLDLNPKNLPARLLLARLQLEMKDWDAAQKSTADLIRLDTRHRYVEAYVQQAIARFQLHDPQGAEASIQEAIHLDTRHDFPRAEYVLGMILQARHDTDSALRHMKRYLELEPRAADAAEVRARIEHINDPPAPAANPESAIAAEMEHVAAALQLAPSSDAWVPGGLAALAKAAGIPSEPSSQNFFAEFCRALVRENSPGLATGIPHYRARLLEYFASVAQLGRLGQRTGDTLLVSIDLTNPAARGAAAHILELIGWKLKPGNLIEPGDEPADGLRQSIPALLGIDEVQMQRTLAQGKSFELRIPTADARLIGGEAWSRLVRELPAYPGGIAEAFVRDPRLAKVYAGLAVMGAETAAAVVSSAGLQTLVERDADLLAKYPDAFALAGDHASVPGNPDAWTKLAGVNPHTPAPFFHALLDRDSGSLAAFCTALAHADQSHQRYFTATPARAERFYAWYRDSEEARWSLLVDRPRWRTELLGQLPLDDAGHVRFPGGRDAWTTAPGPEDEALLKAPALDSLVRVARIEQRRGAPLDSVSARLLAANFSQWSTLFPYFENLRGLGAPEFQALDAFTRAVAAFPPDRKRAVLGEWDSLIDLIARAARTGSLDPDRGVRAFREACQSLILPDHAARSLAILNEIGGTGVLRFTPEQRARFQRVLALLRIPPPDAAQPQDAVAALSGSIYAASLDPDALLLNVDPRLLFKHQFAGNEGQLFPPARLVRSNTAPGSYLSGTFVNLDEIAHRMPTAERNAPPRPIADKTPAASLASAVNSDAVEEDRAAPDFRTEGRLVEVYATVTDAHGRYVDDLTRDQFSILDGGQPRPLTGFESRSSELSVALLLDTTASMVEALPALKAAALRLIAELRPGDQVAVYSFNETVSRLVPFTADKDAAKRAVLHTEPFGETALYDALARVNHDLAARTGKKVMIVFTDGDDNASTLTAGAAIERVKAAGVPVYTIAEGAALINPDYLKLLAGISSSTGGISYAARNAAEIHTVFEKIAADLLHTYFFAFPPEGAEGHAYHPIEVLVRGAKSYKVRAREGYYPE